MIEHEIEDEGREWDKPYLPPPWSAVQDDETGLWEVVCDGYDDEMPIVCAGTEAWPLSEADANILAASLDLLEALKAAVALSDGLAARNGWERLPEADAMLERMRAAIAKAEAPSQDAA